MHKSISIAMSALLGLFVLSACRSTAPQGTSPLVSTSETNSSRVEQVWARLEQTPDSLATLPRPLYYRSSAPVDAPPLKSKSLGSRIEVEAVGGIADQKARKGLRIHSVVSDSVSIRPFPYVDLYGRRMMMRRGQTWRTLWAEGDSLHEGRFIPLSVQDLQRLVRADTARLDVNWVQYRLPTGLQDDLRALYAEMPDSLSHDTTGVKERLTVLHSAQNKPSVGGPRSFVKVEYPDAARERGIEGKVHVGFLVLRDGSTSHLQIEQPAHPLLNAAALQAVNQMKFEPGTHRGRPVPVWMSLPISFRTR